MKARAICTIAAPNAPAIEGGRNENLLDIVGGAASLVGRSVSESARAAKFWSTVLAIWGRYKVTQVRTRAALGRGNTAAAERLWKHRHAHEADVIWRLCVDMRGFYVKAGQLIALQAFVPSVIRLKLSQLHDNMPAMPREQVGVLIDEELRRSNLTLNQVFSELDLDSVLGSASIAQVHKGRLRNNNNKQVAVKIQYPGGRRLMDKDLGNFQFLVGLLERTEMAFDLSSPVKELRKQISLEFDFINELRSMNTIRSNMKRSGIPVGIPYGYAQYSTPKLLVMEYINGTPLSQLEERLKDRNISAAKRRRFMRKILKKMAKCYAGMVLNDGFFQADSHPGNILVTNRHADIALLDFGQTKRFPPSIRRSFAAMVLAVAKHDASAVDSAMKNLGIALSPVTSTADMDISRKKKKNQLTGAQMLAYTMFDTADVPGVANNPFAEDSALKSIAVDVFPPELFFLLRTVQIFKGMAHGSDNCDFSLAKEWVPMAKKAVRGK